MNIKEAIREIARREGVTEAEVRREIQRSIDEAWKTPTLMQLVTFPEGKPDVETFVLRLLNYKLR